MDIGIPADHGVTIKEKVKMRSVTGPRVRAGRIMEHKSVSDTSHSWSHWNKPKEAVNETGEKRAEDICVFRKLLGDIRNLVSGTLLSILTDLNNAMVWMVLILPVRSISFPGLWELFHIHQLQLVSASPLVSTVCSAL